MTAQHYSQLKMEWQDITNLLILGFQHGQRVVDYQIMPVIDSMIFGPMVLIW